MASLLPFTSVMAAGDALATAGLTSEQAFGTMAKNPHTRTAAQGKALAPIQKVASLANTRVQGVMMYDKDKDVTTTGARPYYDLSAVIDADGKTMYWFANDQRELTNGYRIRRGAIDHNIPLITNVRLAKAFIHAFCSLKLADIKIKSWQEYDEK